MQLATIRIQDTEILSLSCTRLDAQKGAALVELVAASARRGAGTVVLDFGPETLIDFAGARAIAVASAQLDGGRALVISGLGPRARTLLRAMRVTDRIRLVEWWTDALERSANAA